MWRLRKESGQATIEFALLLPLLLLILFGIVDFGRAVNYYNTLTQLAAEGARAAAVNATPDGVSCGPSCGTQIQDEIKCKAASNELRSSSTFHVTITSAATGSPDPIPPGQPVQVQTTYTFNFIPFLKFAGLNLVGSATMRAEQTSTYALGPDSGASCP